MNRWQAKQNELDGGKTTERGQELMKAVGMTGKTQPAEQQLQATQPVDSPSGTGLKTHGPQLAGRAAKTTAAG